MFTKDHTEKEKTKAQYFEEVKQLLRRKNGKSALNVLVHALEKYPGDPFLLSYYGCLLAIVENRTDEGIKICEDAIKHLDHSMPFGSEFFYPVFYLNLGRAYLKGDDKKSAITAFREGLRNEPDNHDLQWEMKKLGVRKGAAIPFLKRSNPVNKYIGMLRSKVSK
ncbi:MAG: hypothetical protein HZA17_14740 [Nitrospirae bacterium]|nr:hypothetical protein [Nitrospirota bacterium]